MQGAETFEAVVAPERGGERLDVFAAELAGVTRSRAGALIREGRVAADGPAGAVLRDRDLLEAHRLELPLSLSRRP